VARRYRGGVSSTNGDREAAEPSTAPAARAAPAAEGSPPAEAAPAAEAAEAAEIIAILERNRRTFAWKTGGLDRDGLRATTAASSMTLGGLVKHLALVEADWIAVKLAGQPYGPPWDEVDFDQDPDWEWRTGAEDEPAELYRLWDAAVERSRAITAQVIRDVGLTGPGHLTWPDGRQPTVRFLLLDMIEEYARHTGHADLLRESVDGLVGEGAPPEA
jgi:hypothetical protein